MTQNLKTYLGALSEDAEVRERLLALAARDKDEAIRQAVADAAERGLSLSEADFQPTDAELNEEQLDAVAAGAECYCIIGGGGTATSKHESTCACVAGGGGEFDWGYDGGSGARCVCIGVGNGTECK